LPPIPENRGFCETINFDGFAKSPENENQKNNLLKLLKDFSNDSRNQGFLRDRQFWPRSLNFLEGGLKPYQNLKAEKT
jgi:hypothetical protein